MERSRPTMKDVAVAAGVSLKTVSRVVNDEPDVHPLTEQRVREAIEALGFRRNDSARQLRTGQAATVGLVLEDIGDPFYSALSRGVETVARARGSLLLSGSSEADPETEHTLALALCARRVAGLIMVPTGDDHGYLVPEMMAGVPVVFVDRPPGRIDADTVLSDNIGGARTATAHLIAGGHRRIGHLGDDQGIFTARERHQGYRAAMADADLPVADEWVAMAAPTAATVRAAVERMLAGPAPVTGLVCGNNRISVLVLHVLADKASSLAMVGFDDFELADLLGVTVVAQDAAELGRQAADLLFRRLDGDQSAPRRSVVPTRVLRRGSGERRPAEDLRGMELVVMARNGWSADAAAAQARAGGWLVQQETGGPREELGVRIRRLARVRQVNIQRGAQRVHPALGEPDLGQRRGEPTAN